VHVWNQILYLFAVRQSKADMKKNISFVDHNSTHDMLGGSCLDLSQISQCDMNIKSYSDWTLHTSRTQTLKLPVPFSCVVIAVMQLLANLESCVWY